MDLSNLSSSLQGLSYDPLFNFGTGLMAASGPSLMPHSLGQGLASAAQYSSQAQERAAQARMLQLQAARFGMQNQAIAGVLGGGQGGLGAPSMGAGGAPILASGNGTPGQSFAAPQQGGSPVDSAGGMMQDPMFKLAFGFDPAAAGKQYLDRAYPQPTDIQKNMVAAGIDPHSPLGQQILQQTIAKANYMEPQSFRPGGWMRDPITGKLTQLPTASPGNQIVQDPQTGAFTEVPVQGGLGAVAASSQAQASGKASFAPMTYQDANGVTHTTTQAQFAGSLSPAYIGATQQAESGGNPNAVSPAGASGPMGTMPQTLTNPGFGVTPAKDNSAEEKARVGRDYLAAMTQKYGGNPMAASAAYNWGPENFDKALQASGGNVYAALAQAPKETQDYVQRVMSGTATQKQEGPAGIAGPSAGYAQGQQTVAKSNAERYQAVQDAGATAANRMNVYDNLRGLLTDGVQTGHGTEWQNKALSTIMNTPVLSAMIPDSAKSKAINYQVAMKYIAQGTLQRFQSQRGTGTDSQLEAVAHGNTNPEQLAGAMQSVSRYLESQDMADLAKANAQQQWAEQNGYDYSKQDHFENQWRKINNPLVFQYKTSDAAGRQQILKGLNAQQRNKLASDMESISPYITTTVAGQ